MTQQQPGGYSDGPVYASAVGGRNGMAVASLIFGITGVLLAIVLVGIALGIVAIVLGSVAVAQISARPGMRGRGMAWTGLGLGVLAVLVGPAALAVAVLLPTFGHSREMSNRSVCAANLRGITQSMIVYADENADIYPVLPFAPLGAANGGTSTEMTGERTGDDAIRYLQSGRSTQNGSVLAAEWMLVLHGQVMPKQFICRSDPASGAPAAEVDATGVYHANFQSDDQISYSFAYPYAMTPTGPAVGGWWKNTSDASQVVGSDMAPLNGTGKPPRTVGASWPPAAGARAVNSGNHLGDGQNVAFADGHAEFCRRPDVGTGSDNFFTLGAGGPMAGGMQPVKGPLTLSDRAPYDTVVVPARNLDTGKLW